MTYKLPKVTRDTIKEVKREFVRDYYADDLFERYSNTFSDLMDWFVRANYVTMPDRRPFVKQTILSTTRMLEMQSRKDKAKLPVPTQNSLETMFRDMQETGNHDADHYERYLDEDQNPYLVCELADFIDNLPDQYSSSLISAFIITMRSFEIQGLNEELEEEHR
jgi:hypothetical protein